MLDVRCMDEVHIRGLFTIFIDTSELMHLGISFQLCLIHSPLKTRLHSKNSAA